MINGSCSKVLKLGFVMMFAWRPSSYGRKHFLKWSTLTTIHDLLCYRYSNIRILDYSTVDFFDQVKDSWPADLIKTIPDHQAVLVKNLSYQFINRFYKGVIN